MKSALIVIGFVSVIVVSLWAGATWTTFRVKARESQRQLTNAHLNEEVDNLFTALQKYKERVGSFPAGGNADVAKALQGNNSKNVIVIVGAKLDTNDKGEYIDPWGTPLRIYFSDSGIVIRSAGVNRRFDDPAAADADDIIRSN